MVKPELVLGVLGVIFSAISLVLSVASFVRTSPSKQRAREQEAAMITLTTEVMICYKLFAVIGEWRLAHERGNLPTQGVPQPAAPTVSMNQGALEERGLLKDFAKSAGNVQDAIRAAISKGLWLEVAGTQPRALLYHTALMRGLHEVHDTVVSNPDAYESRHFFLGLIRLLSRCRTYACGRYNFEHQLTALDEVMPLPEQIELANNYIPPR